MKSCLSKEWPSNGFTFIELLITLSIIVFLAVVAIPNFIAYKNKTYTLDPEMLFVSVRDTIEEFYQERGRFPKDYREAGLQEPDNIQSNFVASLEVEDGAVHITYNNKADDETLKGYIVTYRPALFSKNPSAAIVWVCGVNEPPKGFLTVGKNRTNVPDGAPTYCIYK
jgi:type IV pilus assembly protein PilA